MNKQEEIIETVIRVLSEALAADSHALNDLLSNRVTCNMNMANHPHIVTSKVGITPSLSTFGLINGIISALTGSRIAMVIPDDHGSPIGFTQYVPNNRIQSYSTDNTK